MSRAWKEIEVKTGKFAGHVSFKRSAREEYPLFNRFLLAQQRGRCYSQEVAVVRCLQEIEKHATLVRQQASRSVFLATFERASRSAVQAFDRNRAKGRPASKPKPLQLNEVKWSLVLRDPIVVAKMF